MIPCTSTLISFEICILILYNETSNTSLFMLFIGISEINMYPELDLSKILSHPYALGVYTIVGLKEVHFGPFLSLNQQLSMFFFPSIICLVFLLKQTNKQKPLAASLYDFCYSFGSQSNKLLVKSFCSHFALANIQCSVSHFCRQFKQFQTIIYLSSVQSLVHTSDIPPYSFPLQR